jgi:transposase InsO family protein
MHCEASPNTWNTLKPPISHCTLKNVHSDNGGEYVSDAIKAYFRSKAINQQLMVSYTPQQNGKSERLNQIMFQIARTVLKYAGMPNHYWPEAALYANYVKNRIPDKHGITPYEKSTRKCPTFLHMKVFGYKAFAFIPSNLRKNLENKIPVVCSSDTPAISNTDYWIYRQIALS